MTMFLGKISTKIKTAPSKLSNRLPSGVFFEKGKYYYEKKEGQKTGTETKEIGFQKILSSRTKFID